MDIKSREEILLQRNASIGNNTTRSSSLSPTRIPRARHASTDSSNSTVISKESIRTKEENEPKKKKKVNLAVINQKKKEMVASELLKTLDEYVRKLRNFAERCLTQPSIP